MDDLEKTILKKILEINQSIGYAQLNMTKLVEKTGKTEEEVYKAVSNLIVRKCIEIPDPTTGQFNDGLKITEKGLNTLDVDWSRRIERLLIGIATIVSIAAFFYNP